MFKISFFSSNKQNYLTDYIWISEYSPTGNQSANVTAMMNRLTTRGGWLLLISVSVWGISVLLSSFTSRRCFTFTVTTTCTAGQLNTAQQEGGRKVFFYFFIFIHYFEIQSGFWSSRLIRLHLLHGSLLPMTWTSVSRHIPPAAGLQLQAVCQTGYAGGQLHLQHE